MNVATYVCKNRIMCCQQTKICENLVPLATVCIYIYSYVCCLDQYYVAIANKGNHTTIANASLDNFFVRTCRVQTYTYSVQSQ